ncbi:MAG: quinone-dependent dihydroorotate dehydrogenase, partial [Alphaproteobacteria bacterium]|nr:quinone-dependent dihydroorotate dehydrogenase [Alphaproteobacteria bacterium]
FVEIGTVTPRPQLGNPKPRVFRVPDRGAVINRLGFNNDGLAVVAERLRRLDRSGRRPPGPIGANIGCNKDSADPTADYRACVLGLAGLVDYLTVNVSSPNTPGLRALQSRAALARLIEAVQAAREEAGAAPPILLKIAPDLTPQDIEDIARVALDTRLDGLIIANTTIARPDDLPAHLTDLGGGMSGRPLLAPSTALLRQMARLTERRVPLIGVGGIASGADAYAKIRAGATLVQLYTALIYDGPGLVGRIKADLAAHLAADGFTCLADAVGAEL